MKKKLIAAVTSLVMVATLAPATAFAGTTVTPGESVKVVKGSTATELTLAAKNFQDAVDALTDVSKITYVNAKTTADAWASANAKYDLLEDNEKATVTEAFATLKNVKEKIVSVCSAEMEKEINAVTATLIEADEDFSKITPIESIFTKVGTTASQEVGNYTTYTDAKAAKAVASAIEDANTTAKLLEASTKYSAMLTAVEGLENVPAFRDAKEEIRSMASNYSLYKAAKARIENATAGKKAIKDYVAYFTKMTTLLNGDMTEANIAAAEKLLKEAKNDATLQAALVSKDIGPSWKELYTNPDSPAAKELLEAAIENAKIDVQNTKTANEYTAKVDSIKDAVSIKDIATIQELYELYDDAAATGKLTDVTKEQAAKLINDMKTKVLPSLTTDAQKEEFTKAVIAAFPVPDANDVTLEDEAAINTAYTVVVGQALANSGKNIDTILVKDASYLKAVKLIEAARAALNQVKKPEAYTAINKFIEAIPTALSAKDLEDPAKVKEYALKLDAAKKLYDALPTACQEGGSWYTTAYSGTTALYNGITVQSAYEDLMNKINKLNNDTTAADNVILVELIAGIDGLADVKDLTIADKDAVYALRDMQNKLSKNGKAKFTNDYPTLVAKLTDAIKKIDGLVVTDLIKQIDALTIVKPDASLEDIQKAKAANAAAREAYDALTDTQQKEVTNSTVLEKAEKAVADAEVQYVKTQLEAISKLDINTMDYDQAKQVQAIADMIAGMDDAHKKTVTDSIYYKAFKVAAEKATEIIKAATALENATITAIPDQTYTGKAIEPAVEVKDAAGNVIDANAYTVSYENNINAGTAKVVVSSKTPENPTGHQTATFTIKPADASGAVVTVGNKTYTGKALTPAVKVVVNGKTLAEDTDYTVAYANNVKVGKATVTITGQGNYTGTAAKAFVVKPGKANVTSLKAGKKKATVKIKAIPGATTYKIAYKQRGTSYKYKYTTTSATAKTITGLKSGKVYKVKVLAYTKVNGKSYYTGYSTIKTVKVK